MRHHFFLLYTAFALGLPAAARAGRVILISADGMRPDVIAALGEKDAPNFHRLMREGASTLHARTDVVYTITLPNHTCMVTSRGAVGPQGHGWIANSDPKLGENLHKNRMEYVASVFDVVHDHGKSTALYASKSKFSLYDISYDQNLGAEDKTGEDNGRDKIDTFVANEKTAELVAEMITGFGPKAADFTMLHLRDCDSAGHKDTWDLKPGSSYLAAAKGVDELIGRILQGIDASPEMKGKTWVVLTADHGGLSATKGHGESREWENYTIGYFVWGPGVPAGADLYAMNAASRREPGREENPAYSEAVQPIRNGDSGNLALKLLGLPAITGSTINAKQDLMVLGPNENGKR